MRKEDYTELTERYLNEELSDSEKREFEQQIRQNAEMKEDYYLQKTIREVLADNDTLKFRKLLEEVRNTHDIKMKKRATVLRVSIAAASFAIIALVSCYFIWCDSYSNYDLYDKYFKHVNIGIYTRGTSNTPVSDFEIALSEYENEKYKEAISQFGRVSDTSEYKIAAEFFTALSFMELKQFDQAIILFAKLENNTNTLCYEDVLWYNGLCMLRLNITGAAIKRFGKLVEINSCYKDRTTEILEKIN